MKNNFRATKFSARFLANQFLGKFCFTFQVYNVLVNPKLVWTFFSNVFFDPDPSHEVHH